MCGNSAIAREAASAFFGVTTSEGRAALARELLLDEAREGPRLGADLSSRRKNSPKIDRRQQPIVQYGFHRAGFELGREHPVRGDRKAQPRKHAFPNTLRSAHSNAAVDNNRDFGAASSERPRRSAPALVVDDSLVLSQIGRGSRNTHPLEIGRRANHAPLALPNFAAVSEESASWPMRSATSMPASIRSLFASLRRTSTSRAGCSAKKRGRRGMT